MTDHIRRTYTDEDIEKLKAQATAVAIEVAARHFMAKCRELDGQSARLSRAAMPKSSAKAEELAHLYEGVAAEIRALKITPSGTANVEQLRVAELDVVADFVTRALDEFHAMQVFMKPDRQRVDELVELGEKARAATATPVRVEQREADGKLPCGHAMSELVEGNPADIIKTDEGTDKECWFGGDSYCKACATPPIQQIERRDELRGTLNVTGCPVWELPSEAQQMLEEVAAIKIARDEREARQLAAARLDEQEKHGGHMHNCSARSRSQTMPCNCGYEDRLVELRKMVSDAIATANPNRA